MAFFLDKNASREELTDAVNYLLANFTQVKTVNPNSGEITSQTTGVSGYLYRYLHVKYADSYDGVINFSNVPTNRLYYGTYNSESDSELLDPSKYLWTKVTGGLGTTKFFWYATNGGRQIQTSIGTIKPFANYVPDGGYAIDLDLLTNTSVEDVNLIPQLGTLSAVNVDWVPYLGFDTAPPWIGTTAGQFWFDSATGAFNAKMGNNHITQQVGEEFFQYGKASAAIDDTSVQLVYKTGTVGASGVIKFAPAVAGITDTDLIIGIATEPLALNAFGRVTTMGTVHGLNTTGSVYGEVWADNEDIWYNPVTGGLTKTKPVAPNVKLQVGTVINSGSGGSGSFYVKIGSSSILGGTDANVQFGALSNGDVVSYDSVAGYWKNASVALPASGNNPKSLSIFSPSSSENVTLFYTSASMTISHVQAVVNGSTPSVTYSVKSGSDRSVTSITHVSSATVTSTTTGTSATIGTAIIPANSWVWLETSAISGTVTFFSINLEF